jgi:hypothetical protein
MPLGRTTCSKVLPGLICTIAAALAGCWQPPRADVQPGGDPRVIQEGIAVQSLRTGSVQSLDPTARTVALLESARAGPQTYALASRNSLDRIKVGARVNMTVEEKLTVYVPPPGTATAKLDDISHLGRDARVLSIDRGYRLLTLLYPDGRRETFKVAQNVKLGEMQSGDYVAVQSMQVVEVQPRH